MSRKRDKRLRNVSNEQIPGDKRKSPPTKKGKMAHGGLDLGNLPTDLQPLVQLLLDQTKAQHEAVMAEFKIVGGQLSQQIQALDSKLMDIAGEVSSLRTKVNDLETSANYHANELQELQQSLQREKKERIRATLVAERYSMKPDIIVRGLEWKQDEKAQQVFLDFMSNHLNMHEAIPTAAVHRLAKPTKAKPNPPMLVRLVNLHQRESILTAWRNLNADQRIGYAVHEHLPRLLQAARNELVPDREKIVKEARDNRKDVKVSIRVPQKDTCAVLIVNGKLMKTIDAVDLAMGDSTKIKHVD